MHLWIQVKAKGRVGAGFRIPAPFVLCFSVRDLKRVEVRVGEQSEGPISESGTKRFNHSRRKEDEIIKSLQEVLIGCSTGGRWKGRRLGLVLEVPAPLPSGPEDVHGSDDVLPADRTLAHPLPTLGAGDHVTALQQDAVDGRVHADLTEVLLRARRWRAAATCRGDGDSVRETVVEPLDPTNRTRTKLTCSVRSVCR